MFCSDLWGPLFGFFPNRYRCIFGTKQGSLQMYKYKVKQGKVVKTVYIFFFDKYKQLLY